MKKLISRRLSRRPKSAETRSLGARSFVGISALAVAACIGVFAFIGEMASAGPESAALSSIDKSSPEWAALTEQDFLDASDVDPTDGVWREGQAVFSDIKPLDVFWQYARGYSPEQPIKFSHVLHVQKNSMECTYCHSGVNKSPYATIPSVELCMVVTAL